jgi:hypothetical protein
VLQRHHHCKLGLRDWDGAAVPHGGWGFTGSISTEVVSLYVGQWRPRQHQGQELGSRPTPAHPGPEERAAIANQETPMAPNTICLGIDTGVRNDIVAVIHTVSRGCRISGAGHAGLMPITSLVTLQCGDASFTVFRTQCRRSWKTSGARMGRAWPSPVSLWWRR